MSLDHLRLSRPVHIDAVERIEDEVGVVARRPKGRDDRVEHAEIFGGSKDQFVRPLRPPDSRRSESCEASPSGFK